MNVLRKLQAFILLLPLASGAALAEQEGHAGHHPPEAEAAAQSSAADEKVVGEVKKIDLVAKRVTLKHGEIRKFDMPAMTMAFRARELAQIERLAVGDKVLFVLDQVDGKLTLRSIEKAE